MADVHRPRIWRFCLALAVALHLLLRGGTAHAEDGHRLWLRYDPLPQQWLQAVRSHVHSVNVPGNSATLDAIRAELVTGCSGLFGSPVPVVTGIEHDGVLVAGTPKSSPAIAHLKRNRELARLGPEGFLIRSVKIGSRSATVIASAGEANALYGAFHFLRLLQTGRPIARLDIRQKPRLQLRLLNHWDNLDGSIERGYAGRSLWNWSALPGAVDPRLREYARANASLSTTSTPARKACPWTTCARPRLLPRLFVPLACGCISRPASRHPSSWAVSKTADPLDPAVAAWWKAKVDQIYRIIPDFGGFLVKANSEGQPGPRTYNRSHVEGANMLAAALAPHQGVLMWRAFVYDMKAGYDRFGAAYDSLQHFDGRANWVCFSLTQGAALGWSIGPFQGLSGVETRF